MTFGLQECRGFSLTKLLIHSSTITLLQRPIRGGLRQPSGRGTTSMTRRAGQWFVRSVLQKMKFLGRLVAWNKTNSVIGE
jgi:hypothetical protein